MAISTARAATIRPTGAAQRCWFMIGGGIRNDRTSPMSTPVALILFNRADTTARVFAEIARAKPKKLFLIADGPRPHVATDVEKCAAARATVARVDWEC